MKVLVTPRSATRDGHPSLDLLKAAGCEVVMCTAGAQPGEDELRQLLPGCVGYVAGVEPVTARVLERADVLRAISRNGTGVDNVDLAAAKARGIEVLRAEGANARGVAELTIGLLFALARDVIGYDSSLKKGGWSRGSVGIELEGRTLGLAGCGRVGRLVAQMALGIGMRVVAYDPYPDSEFKPGDHFCYASLDEVFQRADFLSLHCPPSPDGSPVLSMRALEFMKRGSFIINTARYDVMDAEAVHAALETGHISGVALDVFDAEPPKDSSLSTHPKVIATPHIGGFTKESIDRAMTRAVENLLEALGRRRGEVAPR